MKVLILSCNTGEGHNSVAKAVKEYFELNDTECKIEDSLSFTSKKMSKFISNWHVRIYRHMPNAFGVGYGIAEKHPDLLGDDSAAYKLLTLGSHRLADFIESGGFDSVICTHVFSALLLTKMMANHPKNISTYFISTDYTAHPGCNGSQLDTYFIPHNNLNSEFEQMGIPSEKLEGVGIPVRQMFFKNSEKAEARRKAGIGQNSRHLLMMCGSMGCGPMEETVELLAQYMNGGFELTVVCGTNRKLYERLSKSVGGNSSVHIRGFVKDISTLMDSADLYFTKPGGISVTEAAIKSLPMVLVNTVSGCETHNLDFFVGRGAAVTAETPQELCELAIAILRDKQRLENMSLSYGDLTLQNAARDIFQRVSCK